MNNSFDDAPCLYFILADNGTFAEVNQLFCRHTGYSREELIGQKSDRLFSVSTRVFQQTHLFPLLRMQGYAEEIYLDLKTKNGEALPVLINATRKEFGESFVVIYAGIVVNNRKKFEDELVAAKKAAERALIENTALRQAKEELQEAAKLLDQQMVLVSKQNNEMRQINRVVTHDLQEPLRKLFLFSNKLLDTQDENSIAQTVQKIQSASEKMRAVVRGLQQYVWLTETPVKRTEVNLAEQVDKIQEQLKLENPEVVFDIITEALPVIDGDFDQIHFLLKEALSNAVRFRRKDQKLIIHLTSSESVRNSFGAIPEKYQFESYLKLAIRDNGTGFDEVYKEQVLELFKRLHSNSGLGVGLALCKRIVENHHGNISIHSVPGQGTTLSILLPVRNQNPVSLHYEKQQSTGKFTNNGSEQHDHIIRG